MHEKTRKELLSLPSIASFISIIISIGAVYKEQLIIASSTLSILSIILIIYLISNYKKYQKIKPFKDIDKDIHRLTHKVRDCLSDVRANANDEKEIERTIINAMKGILTIASDIFIGLTGEKCVASLMLLNENTKELHTIGYSFNVDPQREGNPSENLNKDKGIAGLAFTSKDVVVWHDNHERFVKVRDNYKEYYLSGISIPFKSGYVFSGILNIDCMKEVFNKNEHKQIGAALADIIGALIEVAFIKGITFKSISNK